MTSFTPLRTHLQHSCMVEQVLGLQRSLFKWERETAKSTEKQEQEFDAMRFHDGFMKRVIGEVYWEMRLERKEENR